MAAEDNLGRQFIFRDEPHGDTRMLKMVPEGKKTSVAYVQYSKHNEGQIDVDWLKSHQEGQGHARRIMEHLYSSYPEHTISWGDTVHPKSEHLAADFEARYPDRTSYETKDDF